MKQMNIMSHNLMIIKIHTSLEKRIENFSETINKEIENIKKKDPELKNTVTEIIH